MNAANDDDAPATTEGVAARRQGRRRTAILAGSGVFVVMVVFWALVFTGMLTPHNPDRLPDRAWAKRSDAICEPVTNVIAALPNAGRARSGADRANTLDKGTAMLQNMLTALETNRPNTTDGQKTVAAWLADWHIYMGDREAFSNNLRREGGKAKPLFTQVHGSTAKQRITDFADANSMQNCEAPIDF